MILGSPPPNIPGNSSLTAWLFDLWRRLVSYNPGVTTSLTLLDTTDGHTYKVIITNGVLGVEEVS